MNREAVLHNPVSNYAFPLSYEKFKVRLRAGKGDLDRVTLVIGNKYLWRTRKEFPMEVEGSDQLFDYYSYVYQVDDPRVAYYFLLEKGDEQWLYGDSGFAKPDQVNLEEDESSAFVNFQFPFINPIDIHKKQIGRQRGVLPDFPGALLQRESQAFSGECGPLGYKAGQAGVHGWGFARHHPKTPLFGGPGC